MTLSAVTVALVSLPLSSEVTVYNTGFAVVKEQRSVTLNKGIQELPIPGVAEKIESNSVALKSLSHPGSISVLEQNYRFDLVNILTILQKSIGKEISLRRTLPNAQEEVVRGTLLSAPSVVEGDTYRGMALKTSDGRIILNPSGRIEIARLPEGLVSQPSLVWLLDSAVAGDQKIEVSYLTQGMNWTADYVLTLDQNRLLADLKGWVTLTNQSGTSFSGAGLKLVSGEVFRERALSRLSYSPEDNSIIVQGSEAPLPVMREEAFSEYHLYTSQRPVTLLSNEQKQITLLEGQRIPIRNKIVLDFLKTYGRWSPHREGEFGMGKLNPLVFLEFKNDKESHLGMPMPGGAIKCFQRDSSGSLQMIGEASIQHTPRDEEVSLPIGRTFDVIGERTRTSFNFLTRGKTRYGKAESFEIEIRNRKDSSTTVHLIERADGDYKVSNASDSFTKLDSEAWEFVVALKPNEVKKVSYTLTTLQPENSK